MKAKKYDTSVFTQTPVPHYRTRPTLPPDVGPWTVLVENHEDKMCLGKAEGLILLFLHL